MPKFSIGGTGARGKKARALPEGTLVRIAEVTVSKSGFKRKVRSGRDKGKEKDQYQLRVLYEARESGKTLPYKTKSASFPSEPFEEGDTFFQYLGGVYLADENDPDGDVNLTESGGAYAFVSRLMEAGIDPEDDFANFEGAVVRIDHEKGRGPNGPYVLALPGEVEEKPDPAAARSDDEDADEDHDVAQDDDEDEESDASAYDALDEADKEAVRDAIDAGLDAPDDLVAAGIAEDEDHAQAILDSAPKPAAKKRAEPAKTAKRAKPAAKKTGAKKTGRRR